MKIGTLVMAIVLAFASTTAMARRCPMDMKAIDAAMKTAKLDDTKMAEVKKLRAEGEKAHAAGNHPDAEAALDKAKKLLGI